MLTSAGWMLRSLTIEEKSCVNPRSGLIPDTTSIPPAIDVQS